MSYEEYASYIGHKYRLSTAIAIINTKPKTMSTQQYVDLLRSKVNDGCDLDVTMLSDDFLFDDCPEISESMLKDVDDEIIGHDGDEIPEQNILEPEKTQQKPSQYRNIHERTNTDKDVTFCEFQNDNSSINNEINEKITTNKPNHNVIDDTQKTIIYSVHGFTQNCSYYSPSQNNLTIPDNYIKGIAKVIDKTLPAKDVLDNEVSYKETRINVGADNNFEEKVNDREIENTYTQNISEIFSDLEEITSNDVTTTILKDADFEQMLKNAEHNSENIIKITQSLENYFKDTKSIGDKETAQQIDILDNDQQLETESDFLRNISTDINLCNETLNNNRNDTIKDTDINKIDSDRTLIQSNGINKENSDVLKRNDCNTDNNTDIIEIDRENSSTVEAVPFKVLTECSQVKHFLNKRERRMSVDGYSTDSGYRSDSQSKHSSKHVLPLSQIRLNQAAHCLLNYITNCPLVVNTREITTEIAEVLGSLIDRLHEQETYPPFLEEILENVGVLITRLYEEACCSDQLLLRKDEIIQRLALLNKSVHIQRYSIDKINNILILYHTNLTNTDHLFELANITSIENSYYIFYLLERLLKKYVKKKDCLTQNSEFSQEEGIAFKKSDISAIWKRKWDAKSDNNTVEKKSCVLLELSEILNKIIVDCMNSYSLISYAALNCFNLLQS